jgi:C4-dicarboxylate-specific signal transduction histidine kinase
MFAFDVRTAFLILGLLYLLLPTITWMVLAGQRSTPIALWCWGGLLVGMAAIFISQVSLLPPWVSIGLGGLVFFLSGFARIQSLCLDLGRPWRWRWIVLSALLITMILLGLHYGLEDHTPRKQFFSVIAAVQLAYLAALAWRIGRNEESRNAYWIAWAYALAAAAFLLRLFYLIGDHTATMVDEGVSAQLLSITMLLAVVVGHFGYIGLHLDRSMRRELKAEVNRVRNEERHHLGEQIAQLDRSRALGELAASLGHELNQPLTATLTNAQVAKRGLQGGRFNTDQLTEFLDKIVHNTQRASQIIERIRNFIRPSKAICEPVNLNRVVLEVNELVADEARNHQVRIEFVPHPHPLMVTGDPIQLSQIILNVVRNAIEALSQVVRRELQIRCDSANDRAILRFRDSGPGLTEVALAQVGTPFFTTKSAGLGMGLSISRSIAIQHGGTLTIANADGGGAIVELDLPTLPRVPS